MAAQCVDRDDARTMAYIAQVFGAAPQRTVRADGAEQVIESSVESANNLGYGRPVMSARIAKTGVLVGPEAVDRFGEKLLQALDSFGQILPSGWIGLTHTSTSAPYARSSRMLVTRVFASTTQMNRRFQYLHAWAKPTPMFPELDSTMVVFGPTRPLRTPS